MVLGVRHLFVALAGLTVSSVALTWSPRAPSDVQGGVTTLTLAGPLARWPEHRLPAGLTSATDDPSRVYTLAERGVYEIALGDGSTRFLPVNTMQRPLVLAAGPQALLYVTDGRRVTVLDRNSGQHVRDFPVAPAPHAIAIAGDGHLVMASVLGTRLLHVFSPTGRWVRSFGSLHEFAPPNPSRNRVLNRGIVRTGSDGTIYHVLRHASPPVVRRYSSTGDPLGEFPIEGFAIDLQAAANERLWSKRPGTDAALDVITDAAVDPATNHLWISMPGSSEAGVVYEYDREGTKLAEYRLIHADGRPVTVVRWIVVVQDRTLVALDDGLYELPPAGSAGRTLPRPWDRMSFRSWRSLGVAVSANGCPPEQQWGACSATCQYGPIKDCKAALADSLSLQGKIVIASSCQSNAGVARHRSRCVTPSANRNGLTDSGELVSLAELGVTALGTEARDARHRDRWGNEFRRRARTIWLRPPHERFSWDVWLQTSPAPPR